MNIRATTPKDIDAVMAIIEEARGTIAALGIDQWQNGSPNLSMVTQDMALGQGRVVTADDGAIIGTFALIYTGEPTYDRIYDGAWRGVGRDEDGSVAYIAIHRVAVSVAQRGRGVSTAIIGYAEEYARILGKTSLRIDTHEGNVVMRRMLEKNGFVHCGTIYLQNGDARVAYEKVL
ncbi:MAG: GNAT family N-acetyltransferase [Clostridia bacterium]|nr:GNAT family N-acetyltransferase [Clostridia bacterium]